MPEGVAVGGAVLSSGVHDDPQHPPDPCEEAPRGWTWNRTDRKWQPKVRGQVLWHGDARAAGADDPGGAAGPGGPGEGAAAAEPDHQERDPAPEWMRDADGQDGTGGGQQRKLRLEDVPQEVRDDIAGLIGLVGTPVLAVLQQADPYCGTALAQSFEPIVDATLPLICRSRRIVRYFTEDQADWLLWGKLAIALSPVGKAVVEHHLLRRVETVQNEDGRRAWRPVQASAGGAGDHLQPPAQPEPRFNYAA